jgi:hypothetical protein
MSSPAPGGFGVTSEPGDGGSSRSPIPPRLLALGAGLIAVILIVVIAVVVFGGGSDSTPKPVASAPASATATPAGGSVPLGVFRQTSAAEVKAFESWLGAPVSDVVDFSARDTWEHISSPDYLLTEWQKTGYRLIYAVPMIPNSETDRDAAMRRGANGEFNQYFTTLAQNLVKYGKAGAVLRIGWEFNLDSWPWSIEDEGVYKQYFANIVTAIRAVPGQKFTIDWNVNNGTSAHDAVDYYPGDEYVDEVGVDAYDVTGAVYPYPSSCDQTCRVSTQKNAWETQIYSGERGLGFWSAFAAQHQKPLALPEWGLWNRPDGTGGGDDPYFIQQMHDFIADPANSVAYSAYFEYDDDGGTHSLQQSFPESAKLFRQLFAGQ